MSHNKEFRIQKLISNYHNYSRRESEKLIEQGRIKKNGEVIKLGTKATIDDHISIDDKRVKFNLKHDYYVLNKPKGYISKKVDTQQKEVISLIPKSNRRNLFTIGRLDVLTTGLIVVTNDGFLSNWIQKPENKIIKTYLIFSQEILSNIAKEKIKKGVELDDGYVTKPVHNFKTIKEVKNGISTYRISISEGKKNQIRRMWKAVDSNVVNLKRISIGSLNIDNLAIGEYKKMGQQEIYEKLGVVLEGESIIKK